MSYKILKKIILIYMYLHMSLLATITKSETLNEYKYTSTIQYDITIDMNKKFYMKLDSLSQIVQCTDKCILFNSSILFIPDDDKLDLLTKFGQSLEFENDKLELSYFIIKKKFKLINQLYEGYGIYILDNKKGIQGEFFFTKKNGILIFTESTPDLNHTSMSNVSKSVTYISNTNKGLFFSDK